MTDGNLTGDRRCWRCTIANTAVGLLIAAVPLIAAAQSGDGLVLLAAIGWSLLVLLFTGHRLVTRGYLPLAGRFARATGLHEWIGPGREGED